jgi:hypothetical protein
VLRFLAVAALLLMGLMADVSAQAPVPPVTFKEYIVPDTTASEPTIGIPWTTNNVFFHIGAQTWRATFDGAGEPTWVDVTPPYQIPVNLDPMLIADVDTGRVFAGGLHGICSVMMYSDDDGETWANSINMCSGPNFDHQSIGVGPPRGSLPRIEEYPHVAYYCAQGGTISCARSIDGGRTWLPFQDVPEGCGGFHGHIRVSPNGFVAIPVGDCGERHGFISSADGGLSWQTNEIPGSETWSNGFDPSLQFTRESGWMYYGMASEHGIHVALSKDEGRTWEPLGAGHGRQDPWLNLSTLHDPPIVAGAFTNLQAGDDDRVALTFFGIEAPQGADAGYLSTNNVFQCDERQDELVWRAYYAVSYDAGQTWTIGRVTDDPVQVGGLYDVVVDGSGSCRNLLDFNDMDIDSRGRMYYGIGDGCVDECARTARSNTSGYRENEPRLFRQASGLGLFSALDEELQNDPPVPGAPPPGGSARPPTRTQPTDTGSQTPAPSALIAFVAIAASWLLVRRRV